MNRNSFFLLAGVTLLLFPIWGCENDTLCNPQANLDEMEQNLINELDGQVKGYAYVISKDGSLVKSGADGDARTTNDGQKDMDIYERMQVASLSKSITTVTTLIVLDDLGIEPTASFVQFLPPTWTIGPNIQNATFMNLLNHQAGFVNQGTQGFSATLNDSLQQYIQQGCNLPAGTSYSNTHHGLLRVILPEMLGISDPSGAVSDAFYANAYKNIVRQRIFTPLGINGVDCVPAGANPMLAYSSVNDQTGGGGSTDFSWVAGGIGWNLSAFEVAKIWAYTWFSNTLISTEDRQLMKDNRLGLFNTLTGDNGTYYCKLGGWNFSGNDTFDSCMMHFPDGTQVVIFTNSPRTNGKSLSAIARDAYDAAYGC